MSNLRRWLNTFYPVSKYRVEIQPYPYARWLHSAVFTLLAGSIWLWQEGIFAWQWLAQLLLSGCLLAKAFRILISSGRGIEHVIAIDEQGNWQHLKQGAPAQKIGTQSRVTAWFLCVQLEPKSILGQKNSPVKKKDKNSWFWLLRSQVSDRDYRRLSRIVLHRLSEAQS